MHFLSFLILTTLGIFPFCPFSSATSAPSVLRSLDTAPVLHFTLNRRGGVFVQTQFFTDYVNLTYLAHELERTESRFNLTKRVVKGNKLVRKAKLDESLHQDGGFLMGKIADNGSWFVNSSYTVSTFSFWQADHCAYALIAGMPSSRLASHLKKLRWI